MMENVLEKVTIFITREKYGKVELLLFQHPQAGIQIPAGTVEISEKHMDAALREAKEETGLDNLNEARLIGVDEKIIKEDSAVICTSPTVYARPDINSFGWCVFRRGITVKVDRRSENGFTLVTYLEYDNFINPTYVSYQITGWVPDDSLSKKIRRYFYHIESRDSLVDSWKVFTDNHRFKLFWTPIDNLHEIVTPQDQWVDFVRNKLDYSFGE